MSEALKAIEKHWQSTCRVLFRQEIGPIKDYVPWLTELNSPISHRKSSLSGKPVSFAIGEYSEGSKWIGFEEIGFGKKQSALSINEIKDIDSLISALSERFYYAGNVILGNSGFVEQSSNISDSFYMYETGKLADCKYIGYSILGRLCEDCFGGNGIGESAHCIRSYETFRDKRCFELWMSQNCSDCYYCHGLDSCTECMFSFHLKNRRHCIGNLPLEQGKYAALKEKLLAELAEKLKKEKRLPSLAQIASKCTVKSPPLRRKPEQAPEEQDKKIIEKAFSSTAQLLFGKPLEGGIDLYAAWLLRHTRRQETHPSAFSGEAVRRVDYSCYFELPKGRLVTLDEARDIGQALAIGEKEAEGLTLADAHEKIGKIAFFAPEYLEGTHMNLIECATSSSSSHCYRAAPVVYSKYCAYCFWPRSTEHAFGCSALLDSEFCINCYQSVKLKRCFEMDSCRDCADSYFCHNCENVQNSLFCFNAKNLKYAIGNAEVGKEKFMQAKKLLLQWINASLSRNRDLQADIYNLGAAKTKN